MFVWEIVFVFCYCVDFNLVKYSNENGKVIKNREYGNFEDEY